jgi:hypothetical protein
LSREIDFRRGVERSLFLLGSVALVEGAYAETWELAQEGAAINRELGHRHDLGTALALLGALARGMGDLDRARRCLCEALHIAVETGAFFPAIAALPQTVLFLADQGEVEWAVELYVLVSRYPFVAHSRWTEDMVGRHVAAAAAALPPDVVAVAQERGRARELEATMVELVAELSR